MKPLPADEGNQLFVGGTLADPQFTALPGATEHRCYNCDQPIWFNVKANDLFNTCAGPKARVCVKCFKGYDDGGTPLIRL